MQIQHTRVDDLAPSPWNVNVVAPGNEAKIDESIKRLGLFKPILVREVEGKALDVAMTTLKKAREERYAVLGLDRDDFVASEDLPELVISELTAEQIEKMRATDLDADDAVALADSKDAELQDDENTIVSEA